MKSTPDSGKAIHGLLQEAADRAHPSWRRQSHWVMDFEWYTAIRRACLPADADEEARDESTWVPDPADTVLGYPITVTQDGGWPHLVDGGPSAEFRAQAGEFMDRNDKLLRRLGET